MDYAKMEEFVRESVRKENSDFLKGLFKGFYKLPEKDARQLSQIALDEVTLLLSPSKRIAATKNAAAFYKEKNPNKYENALEKILQEEVARDLIAESCLPKTPAGRAKTVCNLIASKDHPFGDQKLKAIRIMEKGNGAFSNQKPTTFVPLETRHLKTVGNNGQRPVYKHPQRGIIFSL